MSIQEVHITNLPQFSDVRGEEMLYEIKTSLRIDSIDAVKAARVYRFEGITEDDARILAERLLSESIFQSYTIDSPVVEGCPYQVEVAYKPGVMNPEAASIMKAARDLGIKNLVAVDSSVKYCFYGPNITAGDINIVIKRLLVNEAIERVVRQRPGTLVIKGGIGKTEIIPLRGMNTRQMTALSKDRLFLNQEEMETIQSYFTAIGRDPTDCELETLAQTWSEHCVHKTFKAQLMVDGKEKAPLMKRLQNATEKAGHPLVLSAFVDNSGVMDFYDGFAVCGKVETHNSPSAIEPYGGAMTGSGGVFRDIMGTGQGAQVIASTDIFCVASPDLPVSDVPAGCLHPDYLLRRVIAGVRDYGNRMGIPTNNGSIHFHRDFRAKPSIIVGAYGILPVDKCEKKEPKSGDMAVVIGGRTGRDGIHGATFSSGVMTHRTVAVNSSAVQIGNPIEEKRMLEVLVQARDRGLIQAITDCGAGGFGSALGEMGEHTGVEVWLDRVPLKYPGLDPWEIWLSESQERMVLAVKPEDIDILEEICTEFNVEVTIIGRFTSSKRLHVHYGQEMVCDLDMEFLHHGLPQRVMDAAWEKPIFAEPETKRPVDWDQIFKDTMSNLNVCSKEPLVRFYDHGAQAGCVLPPFGGVAHDAPNDAAVITPLLGQKFGLVISHGLNPALNKINPYYGSLWAATEAVSNAVAAGANPKEICLIDNFIWPFPDEKSLGALDMAVDACTDFVHATGMPFISGKDSLSSTYHSPEGEIIEIPPVLCVSAFGRIKDISHTMSAGFKEVNNQIIFVGDRDSRQMAGSTYFELLGALGNNLPQVRLEKVCQVWEAIHQAILSSAIRACHDISEGGIAACLAEMCFGGNLGAQIDIPAGEKPEYFLFNETAGCYLVEIPFGIDPEGIFPDIPFIKLGLTIAQPCITAKQAKNRLFDIGLDVLKDAWQRPVREVFGS